MLNETNFAANDLSPTIILASRNAGQSQRMIENHPNGALTGHITENHRRRWDMIRARQRVELQAMAVCRRLANGDKEAGRKLYAEVQADDAHQLRLWLNPYLTAMQPFLDAQETIERELVKMVKQLPIFAWAESVKGLGAVSLAAIIGELADAPTNYKSIAAVWKRMGLAVIDGGRQRRVTGQAALEHGYNAQRRSIMWNIGSGLIKAQVRKHPDDPERRIGIGDYGTLYLERKAIEAAKDDMTKAHAHNRAQRYIEKRLLKNFVIAWREGA